MKRYVFDACALVAFFNDESGADVVESLLLEVLQGKCVILMNKFNLLEVYYGYLRANGEEFAENILAIVESSGILICDVLTDALFRQASKFKTSYKVSLADSMALAQAVAEQATLVTSDHHEMDEIEKDGKLDFHWVR